ncbi:hypothetical protein CVV26_01165 [Candidatus Kuenenbacteria bacterium HGW-Kuenenbacteria-1]|uniref:Uncharacterized protein n=1 Tax=Candidatus Kuenenbacteria bacterium HGW-Kuenenbacteria-1 TaxID=2013812 RepID=A0A2N1UP67_9BACT|nr:MAG: hypothetical protein CVV26_01165 [Candidatus Kuenenbacteria bacterium HGW-Kuenenbacteria-1]
MKITREKSPYEQFEKETVFFSTGAKWHEEWEQWKKNVLRAIENGTIDKDFVIIVPSEELKCFVIKELEEANIIAEVKLEK